MILLPITAAKSLQSCPTLCDPIDGSPPGSPVPVILQARTLEWVAISFSNAGKGKNKVKSLSRVWRLATPWIAARQAPPSMGFSRQEYWSGVPSPSPLPITGKPYSWLRWEIFLWFSLQKVIGPRDGHMTPSANQKPSLGQLSTQWEESLRNLVQSVKKKKAH